MACLADGHESTKYCNFAISFSIVSILSAVCDCIFLSIGIFAFTFNNFCTESPGCALPVEY